MSEHLFERITIIGLGQMGTSLGLALKRGGQIGHVSGYDLHPDHSATALSIEAIDALCATPEETVVNADLVILCTPVGAYSDITQRIAAYLKPGTILTDIGSIKAQAIRDVQPHLKPHTLFVPSHPIAGSENYGPQYARADFFNNHLFLLTPADANNREKVALVAGLWHSTGATIELLPPDLHDQIYAFMSHLPQLIAYAAMPVLDAHNVALKDDDTLFKRFIRIGRSEPEMWRDVFMENARHLLPAADHIMQTLTHMRDELASGAKDVPQTNEPPSEHLLKQSWPQILASSLIVSVQRTEFILERKLAHYAAGGFIDVTSPASESPEPDFELISQAAHSMIALLDAYLEQHKTIVDLIEKKDANHLLAQLAICQACGKRMTQPLH